MRRLLALAFGLFAIGLLCLLPGTSRPQMLETIVNDTHHGGASYTGYVDAFSGPLACWGLTACSTAIASSAIVIADYYCNSGSNTGNLHVTSAGTLLASDVTSMNTACGVSPENIQLKNQLNPGTADLTFGTAAFRPVFTASAINSLPCPKWDGTSPSELGTTLSTLTAQPVTIAALVERTGNLSAENEILDAYSSAGITTFFSNGAASVGLYAGNVVTKAATDSAAHSVQFVFNGTSSSVTVDGATTTPGTANANNPDTTSITVGTSGISGSPLAGYICRIAVWGSAASAGQISALHGKDQTTYGTP